MKELVVGNGGLVSMVVLTVWFLQALLWLGLVLVAFDALNDSTISNAAHDYCIGSESYLCGFARSLVGECAGVYDPDKGFVYGAMRSMQCVLDGYRSKQAYQSWIAFTITYVTVKFSIPITIVNLLLGYPPDVLLLATSCFVALIDGTVYNTFVWIGSRRVGGKTEENAPEFDSRKKLDEVIQSVEMLSGLLLAEEGKSKKKPANIRERAKNHAVSGERRLCEDPATQLIETLVNNGVDFTRFERFPDLSELAISANTNWGDEMDAVDEQMREYGEAVDWYEGEIRGGDEHQEHEPVPAPHELIRRYREHTGNRPFDQESAIVMPKNMPRVIYDWALLLNWTLKETVDPSFYPSLLIMAWAFKPNADFNFALPLILHIPATLAPRIVSTPRDLFIAFCDTVTRLKRRSTRKMTLNARIPQSVSVSTQATLFGTEKEPFTVLRSGTVVPGRVVEEVSPPSVEVMQALRKVSGTEVIQESGACPTRRTHVFYNKWMDPLASQHMMRSNPSGEPDVPAFGVMAWDSNGDKVFLCPNVFANAVRRFFNSVSPVRQVRDLDGKIVTMDLHSFGCRCNFCRIPVAEIPCVCFQQHTKCVTCHEEKDGRFFKPGNSSCLSCDARPTIPKPTKLCATCLVEKEVSQFKFGNPYCYPCRVQFIESNKLAKAMSELTVTGKRKVCASCHKELLEDCFVQRVGSIRRLLPSCTDCRRKWVQSKLRENTEPLQQHSKVNPKMSMNGVPPRGPRREDGVLAMLSSIIQRLDRLEGQKPNQKETSCVELPPSPTSTSMQSCLSYVEAARQPRRKRVVEASVAPSVKTERYAQTDNKQRNVGRTVGSQTDSSSFSECSCQTDECVARLKEVELPKAPVSAPVVQVPTFTFGLPPAKVVAKPKPKPRRVRRSAPLAQECLINNQTFPRDCSVLLHSRIGGVDTFLNGVLVSVAAAAPLPDQVSLSVVMRFRTVAHYGPTVDISLAEDLSVDLNPTLLKEAGDISVLDWDVQHLSGHLLADIWVMANIESQKSYEVFRKACLPTARKAGGVAVGDIISVRVMGEDGQVATTSGTVKSLDVVDGVTEIRHDASVVLPGTAEGHGASGSLVCVNTIHGIVPLGLHFGGTKQFNVAYDIPVETPPSPQSVRQWFN